MPRAGTVRPVPGEEQSLLHRGETGALVHCDVKQVAKYGCQECSLREAESMLRHFCRQASETENALNQPQLDMYFCADQLQRGRCGDPNCPYSHDPYQHFLAPGSRVLGEARHLRRKKSGTEVNPAQMKRVNLLQKRDNCDSLPPDAAAPSQSNQGSLTRPSSAPHLRSTQDAAGPRPSHPKPSRGRPFWKDDPISLTRRGFWGPLPQGMGNTGAPIHNNGQSLSSISQVRRPLIERSVGSRVVERPGGWL